jgi:ribosomal protein S18 acetylase RimI-like enzyme
MELDNDKIDMCSISRDYALSYLDECMVMFIEIEDDVEGEIIGLATFKEINNGVVELMNIALDKQYRRKGFGTELLHVALASMNDIYEALWVGVPNMYPKAQDFFKKNGFEIFRIQKDYFLEHCPMDEPSTEKNYYDKVYMRLLIKPAVEETINNAGG